MLYCYWCGSWFFLNEGYNHNAMCLCQMGYLFYIDIALESDMEISMEEFLND